LLARALSRDAQDGRTLIVHDVTGDLERYIRKHCPPWDKADMAKYVRRAATLEEARRALKPGWFSSVVLGREPARIVFLHPPDIDRIEAVNSAFVELSVECRRGWVYATDETESLIPNGGYGIAAKAKDARDPHRRMLLMVSFARNKGCRVYLACKRPQLVHTYARQQARVACVFRMDSDAAVNGCNEWGNPELFEPARALPRGEYLYRPGWRPDPDEQLELYDNLTDPVQWDAYAV
jgi:hypothetical protein